MDLLPFVGEDVCVQLYRHHQYREYSGKLIIVSGSCVCLEIDGRRKWVDRPRFYRDSIELEK